MAREKTVLSGRRARDSISAKTTLGTSLCFSEVCSLTSKHKQRLLCFMVAAAELTFATWRLHEGCALGTCSEPAPKSIRAEVNVPANATV